MLFLFASLEALLLPWRELVKDVSLSAELQLLQNWEALPNSNCVSIISSRLVEVEVAAGRLRLIRLKDVGSLPHVGLVWRRGEKLTPIAARFARITRTIAQRDAESSS